MDKDELEKTAELCALILSREFAIAQRRAWLEKPKRNSRRRRAVGDVKVTQADRDAAAASALAAGRLSECDADAVRQGGAWDNWPLVQAFARHRIAAMEESAKVAEAYKPTDNGDPGDYGSGLYNGGIEASERIAAAIRERIEQ